MPTPTNNKTIFRTFAKLSHDIVFAFLKRPTLAKRTTGIQSNGAKIYFFIVPSRIHPRNTLAVLVLKQKCQARRILSSATLSCHSQHYTMQYYETVYLLLFSALAVWLGLKHSRRHHIEDDRGPHPREENVMR